MLAQRFAIKIFLLVFNFNFSFFFTWQWRSRLAELLARTHLKTSFFLPFPSLLDTGETVILIKSWKKFGSGFSIVPLDRRNPELSKLVRNKTHVGYFPLTPTSLSLSLGSFAENGGLVRKPRRGSKAATQEGTREVTHLMFQKRTNGFKVLQHICHYAVPLTHQAPNIWKQEYFFK